MDAILKVQPGFQEFAVPTRWRSVCFVRWKQAKVKKLRTMGTKLLNRLYERNCYREFMPAVRERA